MDNWKQGSKWSLGPKNSAGWSNFCLPARKWPIVINGHTTYIMKLYADCIAPTRLGLELVLVVIIAQLIYEF